MTDAHGYDYFFHHTALPHGTLLEHMQRGLTVSWVPGMGPKGPRAEQIEFGGGAGVGE